MDRLVTLGFPEIMAPPMEADRPLRIPIFERALLGGRDRLAACRALLPATTVDDRGLSALRVALGNRRQGLWNRAAPEALV
jgi:hypothetical protein